MSYVVVIQEWDLLKEREKSKEIKLQKDYQPSNNNVSSFGYVLQQARIQKRLTTSELASMLNIESRMISLYESGVESPSHDIAENMRQILDL